MNLKPGAKHLLQKASWVVDAPFYVNMRVIIALLVKANNTSLY